MKPAFWFMRNILHIPYPSPLTWVSQSVKETQKELPNLQRWWIGLRRSSSSQSWFISTPQPLLVKSEKHRKDPLLKYVWIRVVTVTGWWWSGVLEFLQPLRFAILSSHDFTYFTCFIHLKKGAKRSKVWLKHLSSLKMTPLHLKTPGLY